MSETIVVLGGGIAGLSAAHELVERGFDVEVYEMRERFGGKARSVPVPDSAAPGTRPLPGEHGFRFFPSFYRHLFDTMRRIPYGDNDEGVFGNLVATEQTMIAMDGEAEVDVPHSIPEAIEEWDDVLDIASGAAFDVPAEERRFFADRLLTFLTTCEQRRREELDDVSWWEYIDAGEMSDAYQEVFAVGLTRMLVAMRAEVSSTRTIGRIYVQLLLGAALPWLHVDSLLNGPTNEVWIDPWTEYLAAEGATLVPGATVTELGVADGRITHATVAEGTSPAGDAGGQTATDGGARAGPSAGPDEWCGTPPSERGTAGTASTTTVTGDHYVLAVPVEVVRDLAGEALRAAAPSLEGLDALDTAWMNGVQFYFDAPTPMDEGHVIYNGTPWALTSVSQGAFWDAVDLSTYGDGTVEDIVSICISNWTTPGIEVDKPAKECSPAEIRREVLAQIQRWLDDTGRDRIDEDAIVEWFLDPDIQFPAPNEATNAEPLLINTVGSLADRPPAATAVPNLWLAGDYVRTNTDLATMEAANEAARRAVNGILEATNSDADPCDVWDLEEPAVFEPLKAYDALRYEMGLPHRDLPPEGEW